jgi:biotin operon repressor
MNKIFNNMNTKAMIDKVLELSIEHWNQKFVGVSALEICEKLSVSNEEVMKIMENLRDQGKGSINANVELYPAKFNPDNLEWSMLEQGIITHMFFPSKEVLTNYFYVLRWCVKITLNLKKGCIVVLIRLSWLYFLMKC